MNWKAEAAEKLHSYRPMKKALINIPKEIKRLEVAACAMKSATGSVAVKGGSSRREELLLSNMVFRQELKWTLEQTKAALDVTERALRVLSPEEKLILEQLYINVQAGGLERLCQKLGVERSSIYRRRDQALRKFTMALYGIGQEQKCRKEQLWQKEECLQDPSCCSENTRI